MKITQPYTFCGIYIVLYPPKSDIYELMKENYDYLDGKIVIAIIVITGCIALLLAPYFLGN